MKFSSTLPITPEQIEDLQFATSKMHGEERRSFIAEMALKYCNGSARKTESLFGWGRDMVNTGLGEKRTGIICIGAQSGYGGNISWEKRYPEVAEALCKLAESHAQQDTSFLTEIAFTRLTAEEALKQLRKQGFLDKQLPVAGTMAKILNRLGFRLRPVVKSKPLKKIPETDAIFNNIKEKNLKNQGEGTTRLSIDCKATIKLGEFSRGGLTRGNNTANDHDMGDNGKHTPFGIVDEDSGQLFIHFGSSAKTSDFIVDLLNDWWDLLSESERQSTKLIQIKVDNGTESSGIRTQFLKRMVVFVDAIGIPVKLLYYPPCHSKYNPVERCWGVLEMHWNGAKLVDTETMLAWAIVLRIWNDTLIDVLSAVIAKVRQKIGLNSVADIYKSMTWKGLTSMVWLSDTIYKKGISLTKKAMRAIESRLVRNPELPKWDITIQPI